jgi:hypothetical protein
MCCLLQLDVIEEVARYRASQEAAVSAAASSVAAVCTLSSAFRACSPLLLIVRVLVAMLGQLCSTVCSRPVCFVCAQAKDVAKAAVAAT